LDDEIGREQRSAGPEVVQEAPPKNEEENLEEKSEEKLEEKPKNEVLFKWIKRERFPIFTKARLSLCDQV